MKLKRYILLSALLALLFCSAIFSVSAAAPGDTISLVYGDLSKTYNIYGCSTWEDLVNKYDNSYSGGLFIDSRNRVYYYTFDLVEYGPFYLCYDDKSLVYADDALAADTVYTFTAVTLTFGDMEYRIETYGGASSWFDLADDPLDGLDQYVMIDDNGYMSFVVDGIGTFEIYDYAGDPVNENDDVADTHYTLLLDYTFTIEEYGSGGPTGVKHTISGLVPSFNIYTLADVQTTFYSPTLSDCYFIHNSEGDIVLFEDNCCNEFYLFSDDKLVYELQPELYYSDSPCAVGVHSYVNEVMRHEQTCDQDGFIRYQCKRCTATDDKILPARGHDFSYTYTVIKEPTCKEAGLKARICERCGYEGYKTELEKVDHDRNLIGTCKWCGHNAVGDAFEEGWNNVSGAVGGVVEDIGDGAAGFIEDAKDGASFAGVGSLVSLLSLGLILLVVVVLWPILKPIMEFIGDGIKAAFNAISSGMKSLSKKVKSKTKKKKKS